ncbi:MAG: flagellar filament capping protein FliD [Pseudomonadota bacterium]|nr:flagellar filament capping protein FliD [Pseudomonadota bacterium]
MTTTSSTASSATGASIVQTLGSGSGIDTTSLVASLVQAQYAAKTQQLTSSATTLTTQISAVSQVQSGISSFATALGQLITGGTLQTQPTSSSAAVAGVTVQTGKTIAAGSSTLSVTRLATNQTATTATSLASRTTTVGAGNLTLTFGTATVSGGAMTGFTAGSDTPVTIAIDSAHQTLDGIAQAINASNAGVTATIVTDVDGSARLTLKGPTGTAKAFTLSGDTPELATLNVGVGDSATTIGSAAGNAALSLDGVSVERASNNVDDLIDGVTLTLATTGTTTIGSSRATAGLSQAVSDFVDTFNQLHAVLKSATDPQTGSLSHDSAASALNRSLTTLTSAPLVTGGPVGSPATLAEIGVATNRDGTLSVKADVLSAALAKWPDAVAAIFTTSTSTTNPGLGGILNTIAATATNTTYGLAASTTRYTAAQGVVSDAQTKLSTDEDATKTQLTQQFADMDARVAAYKSTQSFLQAQIDAWNRKN